MAKYIDTKSVLSGLCSPTTKVKSVASTKKIGDIVVKIEPYDAYGRVVLYVYSDDFATSTVIDGFTYNSEVDGWVSEEKYQKGNTVSFTLEEGVSGEYTYPLNSIEEPEREESEDEKSGEPSEQEPEPEDAEEKVEPQPVMMALNVMPEPVVTEELTEEITPKKSTRKSKKAETTTE